MPGNSGFRTPSSAGGDTFSSSPVDIGLLKEAYATLSSPERRDAYDQMLKTQQARPQYHPTSASGPRPAQVISLEEFEEVVDGSGAEDVWRYGCRCGGTYEITEADMERDRHLIGCGWCSEVVWVGYEAAEDGIDVETKDL